MMFMWSITLGMVIASLLLPFGADAETTDEALARATAAMKTIW